MSFIYLASQSPRRRQLLEQIGMKVCLLLPDDLKAAEALEHWHEGEAPEWYVRRVTRLKLATAVRRMKVLDLQPAPLLCADTTVAVGSRVLGKPRDAQEAAQMLCDLSGDTHRVITAVAVYCAGQRLEAVSDSRVRFSKLDEDDIDAYIASDEWQGKAGGYAIQGLAAKFIEHISGSYSGIMGLPLWETGVLLRRAQRLTGDS